MCLLLAGVTTDATVVIAGNPADLAGCDAAFVLADVAADVLTAGVADVYALSGHPLGLPAASPAGAAADFGSEIPSYADHYGGPRPGAARIEAAGRPVQPMDGVTAAGRVLTTLPPADPAGAAVLLGALAAGASLVLLRHGDAQQAAAAERVTATAGIELEGLTRLA